MGIDLGMGARAPDIPALLHAIEPIEPLATLIRLFALGQDVSAATAEVALGKATDDLAEAGLTRRDGDRVSPLVRLTPWRGLVLAHDPDPPSDLWREHVSGPTPAADTLLNLVATNGGRALDLGTGCGIFALAVAASQSEVVATDVNPAALRYAAMNAGLNDVTNVDVRPGSYFEPVAGESFDLILSNPPFVISPESDLLFRHSGFGRDEVSRQVVRDAAERLSEGGFAYVLVNWVQPPTSGWMTVLADWLEETGCDAVCLLHGIEDPVSYAVRWNVREQQLRPDRSAATLDRWLEHFRSEGIDAIGSGAVILRRSAGTPWLHGLELSGDSRGSAAPHVQAIFGGLDVLSAAGTGRSGEERLLDVRVRMRQPHRLIQQLVTRDGEYVAEPTTLVLDEGLALSTSLDPDLVAVVLRLDGSQSGREIAQEVAAATDQDIESVATRVAAFVHTLLELGMVEPAAHPPNELRATFLRDPQG
ncbi:MAG: methyltransferase [Chloroflexota bacterium]